MMEDIQDASQPLSSVVVAAAGGGPIAENADVPLVDMECCLLDDDIKCTRIAGHAAYNKRIQRNVAQRKLKLNLMQHNTHVNICDYHKTLIQSVRLKRKRRDSEDDPHGGDGDGAHMEMQPEVELINLQVNTLRRFKKHYKVPARPGLNKAQLVEILLKQFRTIPVSEKECLTYFIYMIKNNRSKFDQRGSNAHSSNVCQGSASEDM